MYAIALKGFGDPEVMTWAHVDRMRPPSRSTICYRCGGRPGVNRADVMHRMGFYHFLERAGSTGPCVMPFSHDQTHRHPT